MVTRVMRTLIALALCARGGAIGNQGGSGSGSRDGSANGPGDQWSTTALPGWSGSGTGSGTSFVLGANVSRLSLKLVFPGISLSAMDASEHTLLQGTVRREIVASPGAGIGLDDIENVSLASGSVVATALFSASASAIPVAKVGASTCSNLGLGMGCTACPCA